MDVTIDRSRQQQTPLQRIGQVLAKLLDDEKAVGKKNTILVLDGVRGIAVLMVIIFHLNRVSGDNLLDWGQNVLTTSFSTAGGIGVTLFFVLSGFLLFMPFAKAILFRGSWPLTRVYYLRRVFRIVPGYYISLFLLILFANPVYLHPDHWKNLLLFLTFFMDSSHSTFRQINGPYWTLATEWQFYMILPLLCIGIALLVKWVPPRKRLFAAILCLLGIIVWGLAVRYWGLYYLNHPWKSFLWFSPQVVSDLKFFFFGMTGKYTEDFAVGMLISLLYIYAQHPSTSPSFTVRWQRSTIWLWRLGVVILVFSVMWHFKSAYPAGWPFLSGIMPVFNWLSEMLLAIGFGLCIAAILFGNETLQRPFAWRPLRWVGLISYSLYIWHLPLLTLFNTRVLPLLHVQNVYKIYSLYWLWVLLVIFPFALLFFTLVEKPFMRIGDRCRKVIERRYGAKRKAPEASPAPPQPEPQKVASYR